MRRTALAVVALVGCWTTPARADTLPLIEGLPATYIPGQPFTFTIRVPEMFDFTSYTLELVFTTTSDPALVAFPTVAPTGSYVFPTNANFSFQFDAPPGFQEVRLTLFDSTDPPGAHTIPNQNDRLATITVSPGAELTGPITLSLGSNTVFQYFSEVGNHEPPGAFPPIQQGAPPGPVPAPAGVVLLALGGLLVAARARLARRMARAC